MKTPAASLLAEPQRQRCLQDNPDPFQPFDFDFRTDTSSWVGSAQIEVDLPIAGFQNRVIAGFEFLRDDVDRTSAAFSSFCTPAAPGTRASSATSGAAISRTRFSLLESLLLAAGIRYDHA